jgi:hypothetical protein
MRQDQFLVTVSVDGKNYGLFDKMSGGAVSATDTKYRPAGRETEISLGGRKTVENITVERLYTLGRDHLQVKVLMSKVGKGRVRITKRCMDENGAPWGRPLVYSGTLQKVTVPDMDNQSTSVATIVLEIGTDGSVG